MPVVDLQEARDVDRAIGQLLVASVTQRKMALREVFVGRLDFVAPDIDAIIPLHGADLPPSASIVATRDRIMVVLVELPTAARLTSKTITLAIKEIRRSLTDDVFLAVVNEAGTEWQFVYPTYGGGREVLRRMVIYRGQPYRTVAQQLAGIYLEAQRSDLRNALERAYDVEAVTKSFFTEYKRVFDAVMSLVVGLPDDEERKLYCQTLFNRLMFLYFLQRKGWLIYNGDQDYLNALWQGYIVTPTTERRENFYASRLKRLFFTALSSEHSQDYADRLVGTVPFLNGGLFSPNELDERVGVTVPDEAIWMILSELFAHFNFTITESTPYDVEVAVDPEMLGKVFERMVTGRHETGSYYTPRPVVSFMCREALKGYLTAHIEGLTPEAVVAFVDEYDVSGIPFTLAGKVLNALETITIVDPACGSGAYLLGMLHELVELQRLLWSSNLITGSKEMYGLKLNVIEHNVYGVDIDRFAVNIAMLRLWLSLVVDYDGPVDKLPPLPNLDYKIACGDSLTAPDPTGSQQLALAHELIVAFRDDKGEFLHAHGEEKRVLRDQIDALRHDITAMPRVGVAAVVGFDWAVEFAEVFERGGFNVVLANPPYVRADAQFRQLQDPIARQTAITKWKSSRNALKNNGLYHTLYEKWDLYIPFLERAYQLLRDEGQMIFIIPDAYNAAKYTSKSHEFFLLNTQIERIDFCSDIPLFEAGVSNTIVHFSRRKPSLVHCPTRVRRWGDKPEDFEVNPAYLPTDTQAILGDSTFRPDGKIAVVAYDAIPLEDICYVSVGMVIHANEKLAPGQFVAKDLISATQDAIHSKPYLEGKFVARWVPERIRFLEWGTHRAPALFRRPTFPELYEIPEKAISVDIAAGTPRVCYDNHQLYHNHSAWSFVPWHHLSGVDNGSITKSARYNPGANDVGLEVRDRNYLEGLSREFNLKYIVAIMNSRFARNYLQVRRRSNLHLFPDDWKPLPIARVPLSRQQSLIALVDEILSLYEHCGYPLPTEAALKLDALQASIDQEVDTLYKNAAKVVVIEGAQKSTADTEVKATTV